ncbi:MAG: hypothetical protein KDA96_19970 [Planctomycetaceae bacterium]|nr:hypothetical protein [Planctomycetaceae bacterium]
MTPSLLWAGTKSCTECHPEQAEAFQQTAHAQAMSAVDVATEPPDGVFEHVSSGRFYRAERRGSELWHVEQLLNSSTGQDSIAGSALNGLPEVERPLKYLVGSGRHSRTYLVDVDGFLSESPLTWYTSTRDWRMSPGYDVPVHAGFERAVDDKCLICHLGQAIPVKGTIGKADLQELAIGCERCHGPGGEHVALMKSQRRENMPLSSDTDLKIVHPAQLSRSLHEDLCAQCHLRGDATVIVRGKRLEDFRPGTPLADVRVDYHLTSATGEMKVVGHMEQMRASRCYQQSETLSCTTCHDPHRQLTTQQQAAFVREACLQCHHVDSCGLERSVRTASHPNDNCSSCHMPQVATDIPHIAFTHHRIGIHDPLPEESAALPPVGQPGQLTAFSDQLQSPPLDRLRNSGLAYAELCHRESDPDRSEYYRQEAIRLLLAVAADADADCDPLAELARFAWEDNQLGAAQAYAERALKAEPGSDAALLNSWFVLGSCRLERGDAAAAVVQFRALTERRRNSEDWLLLALAQMNLQQPEQAVATLEQALQIQPFRAELHVLLADAFDAIGDKAQSDLHRQVAQRLRQR